MVVGDFHVRERNVLTLPAIVRAQSGIGEGTHGKAISVAEGIVVLATDPTITTDLAVHIQAWLAQREAADPWANLNNALVNGTLPEVPADRYIAEPEPDEVIDPDAIVRRYGDDTEDQSRRLWPATDSDASCARP